jgi:hypothetical protein
MKGMNVKVPVARVIAKLEAKLAQYAKETADYEKAKEKHEADHAKWVKGAVAAIKKGTLTKTDVCRGNREWSNGQFVDVTKMVSLTYEINANLIGAEPEAPDQPSHKHRYSSTVSDIENAIRILQLTDDEHVNATTFKAVSQYL